MTVQRRTKLQRAVDALAEISILDSQTDAALADAVKIAEGALKDIDRDKMFILFKKSEADGTMTLSVASAAGNKAHVEELTPHVLAMLDAIVEADGGKPIPWARVQS